MLRSKSATICVGHVKFMGIEEVELGDQHVLGDTSVDSSPERDQSAPWTCSLTVCNTHLL